MDDYMSEEDALNRINYYIEVGAISIAGYDDNGEAVFEINEDIAKERAPELWEAHIQYVNNVLLDLYQGGLLEVEYDEDLNAIMHFSEDGLRIAKEKGAIPIEDL